MVYLYQRRQGPSAIWYDPTPEGESVPSPVQHSNGLDTALPGPLQFVVEKHLSLFAMRENKILITFLKIYQSFLLVTRSHVQMMGLSLHVLRHLGLKELMHWQPSELSSPESHCGAASLSH